MQVEGITLSVDAPSRTFEGQYHFEADNFQTDYVAVRWTSEVPVDARSQRRKITRIMLYFSRYGLGYPEIAACTSDEVIRSDRACALVDGRPEEISANFYIGVRDEETSAAENFAGCMSDEPSCTEEDGKGISRFAVTSDSHVERRYQWANYDWLHSAFDHIAEIHKKRRWISCSSWATTSTTAMPYPVRATIAIILRRLSISRSAILFIRWRAAPRA